MIPKNVDIIAMEFWDRLDFVITNRKAVAADLGLAPNTFSLWKKRKTYPACNVAYSLAKYLDTTVEELVAGDDGIDHVLSWVNNHKAVFEPPDRLREIYKSLVRLSDSDIRLITVQVNAILHDRELGLALSAEKIAKSS